MPTPAVRPTAVPGSLEERVETAMRELVPNGSAVFVSLDSGRRAEYQPDRRRVAASTIKLPLVVEVLQAFQNGELQRDEPYTVRQADVVGGTGSLQFKVGQTFSLADLVRLAIVESDNVAANVLLGRLGMERVNASMRVLGFGQTEFQRRFIDVAAQAAGYENWTSAADLAGLLRHAAAGTLLNEPLSREVGELLQQRGAIDRNWLGLRLPAAVRLAHINGTLVDVRNDAGILSFGDNRAFILAVCLDKTDASAEAAIAELARRVYALAAE